MAIIGLVGSLTLPSFVTGLDRLQLNEAANDTANFLQSAAVRAEQRQLAMEVAIDQSQRLLTLDSIPAGVHRELKLAAVIQIRDVIPNVSNDLQSVHRFLLLPGAPPPRFGLVLGNARGMRRTVRLDPISGAAIIERPSAEQER